MIFIATIFVFSLAVTMFLIVRVQQWIKANTEYKAYREREKIEKKRMKELDAEAAWQRNRMTYIR